MLKVFLASHAHLASGLKSSLLIFMSECPNLTTYDAYTDGDSTTVQEHLDAFYETVEEDDEVLLLSDIYGGSVNTVMCGYLDRPNTRLVTGVNLAFLIEVMAEDTLSDERLDQVIQNSRDFLRRVELDAPAATAAANSEDDFF